jgi:hypothetical protein
VDGGHEVIAVSRGGREPYHPNPQWNAVTRVTADRDAEDAAGTFGARIAALRPDVLIDLICFTAPSAGQLVDALHPDRSAVHQQRTGRTQIGKASGYAHRSFRPDAVRYMSVTTATHRPPVTP